MNAILFLLTVAPAVAAEPSARLGWQSPGAEEVRALVFAWLEQAKVTEPVRDQAARLWSAAPREPQGDDLLARVVETVAMADPRAQQLLQICSVPRGASAPPGQPWLTDPATPPLVAKNLRLWYGRWLVREALYDEALEQLSGLEPADVVDPALLLFCQAVIHHQLLQRDQGLLAVERLLQEPQSSPRRYAALAKLIQEDLKGLEEDTLDHIARRMGDIRRRLDLGRAGPKVRAVEDGVIASLDKLIKEVEDRQQQQQQAAADGSGGPRSSSPAPDSRILGGKGPGEVVKRNVGSGSGWGNLPPKEREEAMQQLSREFPAHYREVIEQYFRKLAEGEK